MPGYSLAIRNGRLDADLALIGNASKIEFYTSPRPATGGAVGGAVKLATLVAGTPFAPAAVGGVQTANAVTPGTGLAAGTAVWARHTTSGGTFLGDYSVSDSAGAGEIKLTGTAAIAVGQPVTMSSFTRTEGNP